MLDKILNIAKWISSVASAITVIGGLVNMKKENLKD
jgi:hypothetical protein